MPVFVSAIISGVAAVFIGDLFHSAAAGLAALVVIAAVVISVSVARRRRQGTAA